MWRLQKIINCYWNRCKYDYDHLILYFPIIHQNYSYIIILICKSFSNKVNSCIALVNPILFLPILPLIPTKLKLFIRHKISSVANGPMLRIMNLFLTLLLEIRCSRSPILSTLMMFSLSLIMLRVAPFQVSNNVKIIGLHNPLKNPERYFLYGEVNHRIAAEMAKKEVQEYLVKLI